MSRRIRATRSEAPDGLRRRLRMKELVAQTGASREAIRFYINEGLLPEPQKTSRNMAWYSPEHVSRVRYIRALQEEHYLPLKAIRAVLDGEDEQFTPQQLNQFETLRQKIEAGHAGERRRQFAEVAEELSLTPEEQDAAREMGFVNVDGSLGPQDEELIRIWVDHREMGLNPERGFSPRDMQAVQDAVDVIFASELNLFTSRLQDMKGAQLVQLLDRVVPNINRTFALLHERKLRQFLKQIHDAEAAQGDKA